MKKNRFSIILVTVLVVLLGLQLISVVAEEEEPYIPAGVSIEYTAPTTGDTIKAISDTIKCKTDGVVVDEASWADASGSKLGDSDKFASGSDYTLSLSLNVDGGYVGSDSAVTLNDDVMTCKSEAESNPSLYSISVKPAALPAPQAVFTATGLDKGVLSKINSSMNYSTDGGASWIPCSDGDIALSPVSEGEIMVAYAEDSTNIQHIVISRNAVPSGLTAVNCSTSANNDGKITGVKSSMEYRAEADAEYKKCSDNKITGLVPGTYFVRSAASGSSLASGDASVTVAKYTAKVPEITKHPGDSTVKSGQDCKFIVKAKNAQKYEWHVIDIVTGKDYILDPKEDAKYYKGFGTDTITVLSINSLGDNETDCKYSGDKYYCVISNETGSVKTKTATYTVQHVASSDWCFDSSNHWQLCSCGTIMNKSAHLDKDKDEKCDVCAFDMTVEPKEINIVNGANVTWQSGETNDVVITIDEKLANFNRLLFDGSVVSEDDYSLESGSTIISIHPDFLSSYDAGDHTVTAEFKDGSVSTQLTIASKTTKITDDTKTEESHEYKWMNLLVVSAVIALGLLIALIIVIRKLRRVSPR